MQRQPTLRVAIGQPCGPTKQREREDLGTVAGVVMVEASLVASLHSTVQKKAGEWRLGTRLVGATSRYSSRSL